MNLPFLIACAYEIRNRVNERLTSEIKERTILFSLRDCLYLAAVYKCLFGDTTGKIQMFYTSRILSAKRNNLLYDEYIDSLNLNDQTRTYLIDLQGSGVSFDSYCNYRNIPVCTNFITSCYQNIRENKNRCFGLRRHWEELNLIPFVGTVSSVGKKQNGEFYPIFSKTDSDPEVTLIYYEIMNLILWNDKLTTLLKECPQISLTQVENLLYNESLAYHLIKSDKHYNIVESTELYCKYNFMLTTLNLDETKDLTTMANELKTDKGNIYLCAHNYTKVYSTLWDVIKLNPVKLLEIGLNRDGKIEAPSTEMWRSYFKHPATQIHGLDIVPRLLTLNDETRNIFIWEGDQSDSRSLNQLWNVAPFDIIIDDGSHASSHQQITLANLWKFVKPGGWYVIEDLHWQPGNLETNSCPKTLSLVNQWMLGIPTPGGENTGLTVELVSDLIYHSTIELYRTESPRWNNAFALAVFYKR